MQVHSLEMLCILDILCKAPEGSQVMPIYWVSVKLCFINFFWHPIGYSPSGHTDTLGCSGELYTIILVWVIVLLWLCNVPATLKG